MIKAPENVIKQLRPTGRDDLEIEFYDAQGKEYDKSIMDVAGWIIIGNNFGYIVLHKDISGVITIWEEGLYV